MTDRPSDEELARLVGELVRSLRDIERELEPPDGRPRFPTPRQLRRFASEVAIPGLILVLETNVRALGLLQRALELGEDADRAGERATELRDRASAASETTLERLDEALAVLQRAVEGRPGDDDTAELLEEARALREEVRSRLADRSEGSANRANEPLDRGDAVDVDVEDELRSIKEELDAPDSPDDAADGDGSDPSPGDDPGDDR